MNHLAKNIALLLLLAVVVAARASDETREAQQAILELAKDLEEGKDGKARAEAIKKKFDDLGEVMAIYKPRPGSTGFGVGAGIEAKLNRIGKKGMSKEELAKGDKDLIQMGYINLAVARMTKLSPPKGGIAPPGWDAAADAQFSSSEELIKAVKAGDPAQVKAAATKTATACEHCHENFRE